MKLFNGYKADEQFFYIKTLLNLLISEMTEYLYYYIFKNDSDYTLKVSV